jgi:hypothetical protein
MKTKKLSAYILTAALALSAVTSCKDYLDVNPVSSFGPDYVFSNVTNATKAVIGAYSSLGGDAGYGIRVSMYYAYDNDEMMGQGGTPFPDNERRDIAHFNVQPSNTQLANPFNQMYAGIERANICIHYIPKMDMYTGGTESEKRDLRALHGEALALRAQFYYELIRNWGDVPAQFVPSSFAGDLFIPKTDRDVIYEQILADLAEAAQLVPWRGESGSVGNERISQGAVRALRARIALARGGFSLRKDKTMKRGSNFASYYQIARDETNAIIQQGAHKLNPSYEAVFRNALCAHTSEPNGEILWEVGMTGGNSGTGDSKLGYYNGPRWDGRGNGALTILPTYFYSFDEDDKRRDVMCAPYNINANFTIAGRGLHEIVDGKFRRDWIKNPDALTSTAQYFGVNWPMIRYADVLLMFAEAENELNGPTAAAYDAINQVRRRGFGKPITTPDASVDLSGLTKETFFDAIVKERSLELGGEGVRKYDLIRWNMLAQKINETKAALAAMAAGTAPYDVLPTTMYYQANATSLVWLNSFYETQPGSPPAGSASVVWIGNNINTTILTYYAASFTPGKSELLPIHTSIIDANKNLSQDYGY